MISFSHLNLTETFSSIREKYKLSQQDGKSDFGDKEQEKESKGEEKASEEKYIAQNSFLAAVGNRLADNYQFISTDTRIDAHPYSEHDPKPPRQL